MLFNKSNQELILIVLYY